MADNVSSIERDALGPLLPGTGEVMLMVGTRIWKMYHAAKTQNRSLAIFQLTHAQSLMEKAAFLEPKITTSMENFLDFEVERMRTIIDAEDWPAFDEAFERLILQANSYHELYGHPYLQWRVPAEPPADLNLTPRV